jgi:hypothetical protein
MKNLSLIFILNLCIVISTYSQDTINVPTEYTTIQAGINAASNGDIVLVANGTYYENINFKGKAITVASRFFIDGNTNHISNTIINGSQPSHPDSGSVVTFDSGGDTTSILLGFTITGGTGSFYSAIARGGGGIFCSNSGAKIMHNIIEDNHITSTTMVTVGGGISGGPQNDNSWIVIEKNIIRNNSVTNTAANSWAHGGGIELVQNARVIKNVVEFNISRATLGSAWGGGIELGSGGQARIRYCIGNIIWNNKALSTTGTYTDGGVGGGLSIAGAPKAEIRLNDIRYNEVEGNVSLNIDSWGAGVILQNQTSETIFAQNYVAFNRAINNSHCNGAGIVTWNPELPYTGGPKIINNIITNNTGGTWGGGMFLGGLVSNSATLINNTICNDSATYGGAIFVGHSSSYPSNPKIINSILWNNGSSIYLNSSSTVAVRYSNVEGGYTGAGNINTNSLFSDTLFHLSDFSPCIGAGIDSIEIAGIWYYAPLYDFDGNPRPDPAGSKPDIGACENPLAYPLPVELISFTAILNGKDVALNWTTASELNNHGFEIQRKALGGDFATVGFIDGHGTSTQKNEYSYTDKILTDGKYFYRLKQIDFNGTLEYSNIIEVDVRSVDKFMLEQNYPNPFNPSTKISWQSPVSGRQVLKVFDVLGNEITTLVNEEKEAGYYSFDFDASELPSGIYFYRIQVYPANSGAGNFVNTKKMILLK